MRTIVKGKNLEVPDRVRAYAERKFGRLDRLLDDQTDAVVELSNEHHRSAVRRPHRRRHARHRRPDPAQPRRRRRATRPRSTPSSTRSSARRSTTRRSRASARVRSRRRRSCARSPTGPREPGHERADRQDQALRDRADVRGGRGRRDGGARPRLLRVRERRERADQRPVPAARRRLRADRAGVGGDYTPPTERAAARRTSPGALVGRPGCPTASRPGGSGRRYSPLRASSGRRRPGSGAARRRPGGTARGAG